MIMNRVLVNVSFYLKDLLWFLAIEHDKTYQLNSMQVQLETFKHKNDLLKYKLET